MMSWYNFLTSNTSNDPAHQSKPPEAETALRVFIEQSSISGQTQQKQGANFIE